MQSAYELKGKLNMKPFDTGRNEAEGSNEGERKISTNEVSLRSVPTTIA